MIENAVRVLFSFGDLPSHGHIAALEEIRTRELDASRRRRWLHVRLPCLLIAMSAIAYVWLSIAKDKVDSCFFLTIGLMAYTIFTIRKIDRINRLIDEF